MNLALHMSETLGFMSLMALLVAIIRFLRLNREVAAIQYSASVDFSLRRQFLIGFSLYMAGAVIRESVVLSAGMSGWTETEVMISTISRLIQVAGACVYVRAATVPRCGEWAWIVLLTMSTLFAIASPI